MNKELSIGNTSNLNPEPEISLKAVTKTVESPILRTDCWVLENGISVIKSGRGYIRTLADVEKDQNQSGQKFRRLLSAKYLQDVISEDVRRKLEKPIRFQTREGKIEEGFDATALPRLAKDLWEAYITKKIVEGDAFYTEAKNSENIVNFFIDKAITDHIYSITGLDRKTEEIKSLFFQSSFVRDLPSNYKGKFEEIGFFNGLYKIYAHKKHPWKHPSFFDHFINRYIYIPLDSILTDGKVQTKGIMRKLWQDKKHQQGESLYSFIKEVGETKFFGHLGTLVNLMRISKNKNHFEQLFNQMFDCLAPLSLFPKGVKNLVLLDLEEKN